MPDGPGGFAQDSSCPALLRSPLRQSALRIRDCHPLRCAFPDTSARARCPTPRSYNPGHALPHDRFGLFPVRSPLLGESLVYFLFLQVLRCFSSLRSPPHIRVDDRPSGGRVVPFGNRRITGHLHLPDAYRSLSRPSSPPRAKASAVRPSILSRSVTALMRLRLILSAVFSVLSSHYGDSRTAFCLYVLQSCLCQYVKDPCK